MKLVFRKVNTELYRGSEDRFIQMLYPDRREKVEQLKYVSGKHVSIEAGLMLQEAVESELGLKPENIRIIRGKNGKPYIEGYEDFCFNLSHSGDYVALVYGDRQLGIDMEQLKQKNIRERDIKVAKRCFTETECAYVTGGDEESFFEIWTMKESYLKYTGQGISVPLNSFEVNPGEMAAYEIKEDGIRLKLPVRYDMRMRESCIITVCYGEDG